MTPDSSTNETRSHLWKMDDGCLHFMAAVDEETARRVGKDTYSIGEWDDPDEPVTCEMVPDDQEFTVTFPDGLEDYPLPPAGKIDHERQAVTAPAHVWAAHGGNGVYVAGEEC